MDFVKNFIEYSDKICTQNLNVNFSHKFADLNNTNDKACAKYDTDYFKNNLHQTILQVEDLINVFFLFLFYICRFNSNKKKLIIND